MFKKLVLPISVLFIALQTVAAQSSDLPWSVGAESPRISALNGEIQSGDVAALERFWAEVSSRHGPLIETIPGDSAHSLVTFLYRGTPSTTEVVLYAQLIVGRDPSGNRLSQLAKSDVWFKTYSIRNDMRLGYSLIPNPSEDSLNSPNVGIADPLNPNAAPLAAYMGKSVLELPDAPPQPWIAIRSGAASGKIEELPIHSKILNSDRQAWIHTPPGFDVTRSQAYPLLVCFDGQVYASQNYMPVPTIVDNMIADGRIPPLVVVLVGQSPQPNRNIELSNNQPFLDFVADELLPQVRQRWHATADPHQTIVTGSSAGGLAAAFFAFRRSDVFGNVLSQSGAFWPGRERNDPEHEWLTRQFESSPKLTVRFVLQVGLLERGPTPGNGPSILETNRNLYRVLKTRGYEVHYTEVSGGHEPLNWRGNISDGLIQLIGLDRH
ncbi:MAG TPA: alpha/beta hydrolase-fold protein [Candidatus Acidoferrales bacterium]|nr:alpha/beta hydrolase-fold protein [Candidatus Acidoferrales bacterium]